MKWRWFVAIEKKIFTFFKTNAFLSSTLFQCVTFSLTSALLFRFEKIRYVYNRNGLVFFPIISAFVWQVTWMILANILCACLLFDFSLESILPCLCHFYDYFIVFDLVAHVNRKWKGKQYFFGEEFYGSRSFKKF